MDSGAFTTIAKHGGYPEPVQAYAEIANRFAADPGLKAVVAQDWMCEPAMLVRTGKTIREHQFETLYRYALLERELRGRVTVMPVLQGYTPEQYVEHIADYGTFLDTGMWVGVGSVCKRNGNPSAVAEVLAAIKAVRPDLKLHGFGLKRTALQTSGVVDRLYSADSMAWSYAARREGRSSNDWREAARFAKQLAAAPVQTELL
jgi:hypothetical protein